MSNFFEPEEKTLWLTGVLLIFFLGLWAILVHFAKQGLHILVSITFKFVLTLIYIPIVIVESLPKSIHEGPLAFAFYLTTFFVYSYFVASIIIQLHQTIKAHNKK